MKRELVHDAILLARKSEEATREDMPAAQDLLDTLRAHRSTCVGMAGNMIGVHKRIIAIDNGGMCMLMFNPEIVSCSGEYETEESCLSLLGGPRKTKRYHTIKVRYCSAEFKEYTRLFTGFTAQIIQHEIDHLNGILI